jgi:hypothetical protein
MDDIYVYLVDFPGNAVREMTAPCADGYTVYVDKNLPEAKILNAIHHAIEHVRNNDWQKDSATEIEREAHERNSDSLPVSSIFIRCPE